MKKGILFVLIFVLSLSFIACNFGDTDETTTTQAMTETTTETPVTDAPSTSQSTVSTEPADTVAPVISGATDVTIYLNDDTFNILAGVTATDDVDGDLTAQITYATLFDITATGAYYVKYTVEDSAGNRTEASRTITVEVDPSQLGDAMVQNGDFSLGAVVWGLTNGEGASSTYDVVDGVLELTIVEPSWNAWSPRLESNLMTFEQGTTYEITFDAYADAERTINVQVGEILSGAPWFNDFKPGQTEKFVLSTTSQTFTFKFTMTQETNELGQLLFENGTVNSEDAIENLRATVHYDNVSIVEATADPDTQEPTISGISDLTLEVGAVYDELEGVTAQDNLDGVIALDASHVASNVDTSVAGEYTVTYTVSDAAGNENITSITITVVALLFNDAGILVNGDFEAPLQDPAEWTLYQANWDPTGSPMAEGTLSVVEGELVLEAINTGSWGAAGWELQAQQIVDFELGQTYKVVFQAKADVARDLSSVAGFNDVDANAWHGFGGGLFTLSTEMQQFEYMFTVEELNGVWDDVVKFEFAQAVGTVTIDNVQILMLEQDALTMNGDFSQSGWSTWAQDWGNVGSISTSIVNGELVADVTALGDQNWGVQLFQEGIVLVPETTYTITFDAKASVARDINLKMLTYSAPNTIETEDAETFLLTTEMVNYTMTFTYNGTQVEGKLDFEFGNISEASVATMITLDNITITDGTNSIAVSNSTFDQAIGWGSWAGEGGAAIFTVEEEMLVADVTNVGTANWNVQLFQEGVKLIPGATYTIVFDAKASAARDINFKLIDSNAAETPLESSLTTEWQSFTLTFVYEGTAVEGKLDFELGLINASEAGMVYLDNILLYRNFNTQETE